VLAAPQARREVVAAEPAVFVHRLKTYPGQFRAVKRGMKTHDIRREDDKIFVDGQRILLQEWDPSDRIYTGDEFLVRITYVSRGPDWSLPRGLVVLSITKELKQPKGDAAEQRRRLDGVGAEDL
jgi:hypothetical protein